MTFFRKRPAEVAQCTIEDYETAKEAKYGKNAAKDLSKFEQAMLHKCILMKISGKNDAVLSVLIPNAIVEAIDLLVKERSMIGLDPSNNYLFGAQTGTGFVDPKPLFRRFSESYGLKNPIEMRGTNLRKHLATRMHTFATDEHDLERVARFM